MAQELDAPIRQDKQALSRIAGKTDDLTRAKALFAEEGINRVKVVM
jgi:hypothetical protein